jgi:hydroxymethylpyrimidine pyrophosphatase-like HAD family hydrolase
MVLQLGKVASLSVFPAVAGYDLDELVADVGRMVVSAGLALTLDPSTDCVNVLIPGVDKGSGFAWLVEELGVASEAVAGIGDSLGDLRWLAACGLSVAPANAVAEVKTGVDVNLPGQDVAAALAAYIALVEANRRL